VSAERRLCRFDRSVRRALRRLEDQGARLRVIDGGHVLLLPPGPRGATLKVSASRPANDTLAYLARQFAAPNGLGDPR
jgi:hypothetical protein